MRSIYPKRQQHFDALCFIGSDDLDDLFAEAAHGVCACLGMTSIDEDVVGHGEAG